MKASKIALLVLLLATINCETPQDSDMKKKDQDKKRDSIIKYIIENKDILKHPEIKKLL